MDVDESEDAKEFQQFCLPRKPVLDGTYTDQMMNELFDTVYMHQWIESFAQRVGKGGPFSKKTWVIKYIWDSLGVSVCDFKDKWSLRWDFIADLLLIEEIELDKTTREDIGKIIKKYKSSPG